MATGEPELFINQRFTSPNNIHGKLRQAKYIIVHASGQSREDLDAAELEYLISDRSDFVYHAYVADNGSVTQLAPWDALLWHAGRSAWGEDSDLNDLAIGVAFGASETGVYTPEQLNTMRELVELLMRRFDIPADCVLGHKEVSPGRKSDPYFLDLEQFRKSLNAEEIPTYRVMNPKTNTQMGELTGRIVGDKLYLVSFQTGESP